jgi:hypothetical protein
VLVLTQTPGCLQFLCWEDEEVPEPPSAQSRTTGRTAGPRHREGRSRRTARAGSGSDDEDEGPRPSRARTSAILPGRIEPADPDVDDSALRRFAEGMAALATELLLDGTLEQPSLGPATSVTLAA